MTTTMPPAPKIHLTPAQLRALAVLETGIQEKINFTCGKTLSQNGLATYKRGGVFRITARGIRYLREHRQLDAGLNRRRDGARGCRGTAWLHIVPSQIEARRTALGLTQQALADLVGVSRASLSFWEANRWRATLEHQKKLCGILDKLEQQLGLHPS